MKSSRILFCNAGAEGGDVGGVLLSNGAICGWRGDLMEGCDLRDDADVGDLDNIASGGDQVASWLGTLDVDLASPI
jgi:hypothetical protein